MTVPGQLFLTATPFPDPDDLITDHRSQSNAGWCMMCKRSASTFFAYMAPFAAHAHAALQQARAQRQAAAETSNHMWHVEQPPRCAQVETAAGAVLWRAAQGETSYGM